MSAALAALMRRGTEFLGCETAIMCGAMSWVSERHLVSAVSNAGGFGLIACGAMTADLLDTEITETQKRTDKPFGVNLITMHPHLMELIALCGTHGISHIVLAGGLPPLGALDAIKATGAKVIAFAPALVMAKKLIRSGVDALVIEGHERAVISVLLQLRYSRRKSCPRSRANSPSSLQAASGAVKRSPAISKWGPPASSSAHALPAR